MIDGYNDHREPFPGDHGIQYEISDEFAKLKAEAEAEAAKR